MEQMDYNEMEASALNEVLRALIDSSQGYDLCMEVVEEGHVLHKQFIQRQSERKELIRKFQTHLTEAGHEYTDSGSFPGKLHRVYTKFINLFKEDTQTAIDALNTGEDYLTFLINSKLEEQGLSLTTCNLLKEAYSSAVSGEKFANQFND